MNKNNDKTRVRSEQDQYEEQEQDRKRGIKLIDPRFIDQFVEEFEKIVGESVI